jgi:hypothetical protein
MPNAYGGAYSSKTSSFGGTSAQSYGIALFFGVLAALAHWVGAPFMLLSTK